MQPNQFPKIDSHSSIKYNKKWYIFSGFINTFK